MRYRSWCERLTCHQDSRTKSSPPPSLDLSRRRPRSTLKLPNSIPCCEKTGRAYIHRGMRYRSWCERLTCHQDSRTKSSPPPSLDLSRRRPRSTLKLPNSIPCCPLLPPNPPPRL